MTIPVRWPKSRLLLRLFAVTQHLASEALFEHLYDRGLSPALGFSDEQVKVLRHDHITHHDEVIPTANLLEDLQEQVAPARSTKKRARVITAAGDEMQMSGLVTAMQVAWHGPRLALSGSVVCDG